MYKKYKLKKRKQNNTFLIIFVVCISALFMSSGYALLSDTLTITGTANIKQQQQVEQGNSTYSWRVVSSWFNYGDVAVKSVYQVGFIINNNDGDLTDWELQFDVPDGLVPDKLNSWMLETMEATGNTVTITPMGYVASIPDGGQPAQEIIIELPFSIELEELTITNVIFNGKLLQEVIE